MEEDSDCCDETCMHQQILCTSGNFSSCTGLHRPAETWTCSSVSFSQLHRPAQHLKLLRTKKQSLLMMGTYRELCDASGSMSGPGAMEMSKVQLYKWGS